MYRQQALCILAPLAGGHARLDEPKGATIEEPSWQARLERLLDAAGFVHFASLLLLPPLPPPQDTRPGRLLALELVIDPWLPPASALDALASADRGHGVLSELFLAQQSGIDSVRLARFLRAHCSRPAGGYISTRDLSVGQIRQEARLHQTLLTRQSTMGATIAPRCAQDTASGAQHASTSDGPPVSSSDGPPTVAPPDDSRSVAADLRAWVAHQPELAFARQRSPRSFWRARWLTGFVRLVLASVATVLPALVALVGLSAILVLAGAIGVAATAAVVGPSAIGVDVFGGRAAGAWQAIGFTMSIALASGVLAAMRSFRIVGDAFAFAATVILATVFVLTPYLFDFHAAIGLLNRWGAIIIVVCFALLLVTLLAAAIALILSPKHLGIAGLTMVFTVLLVPGMASLFEFVRWAAQARGGIYATSLAMLDAASLPLRLPGFVTTWFLIFATLAFIVVALQPLAQWIQRGSRALLPRAFVRDVQVAGAMQTHPSIERCEARQIGRPSIMISLTEIRRPRWLMRPVLKATLWLISWIGHVIYVHGRLGKAAGIHCGHWHIVDEGRRLLFISNYDGSFGGYLDDFILGAMPGVNLIWRCTELRPREAAMPGHPAVSRAREFPPTRLGMFGGCLHEQWFKTYARDSMLPSIARYEAYRLSCGQIRRNNRLRDALASPADEACDDIILRAFE